MIKILPVSDIKLNYVIILILFISTYSVSLYAIKGNKENTEYTKNIKLTKLRKFFLGFIFHKGNKVEMEAVINQIVNYILTIIFAIVGLYKNLNPKVVGVFYIVAMFAVLIGCLIYRFKKGDLKESNNYYE